jgi:hypothetical protein
MSKNTELIVAPTTEALSELAAMFPQEQGYSDRLFPRIAFVSQDKMEGTGKNKKVVIEAGTFFEERETEELNDAGKKVWSKDELGMTIEGTIIYKRRQLRYFNEDTEEFTSSPIFDTEDEIIPLFCNKSEIARGTAAELKVPYQYVDPKDGKTKCSLEENVILYVLRDGEVYQLNLRGSSMYAFMTYARKTLVPSVLTSFSSEAKEKGTINWNQMSFKAVRQLTGDEVAVVKTNIGDIRDGIASKKAYFASQAAPAIAATATTVDPDADFQ